MPGEEMDYQFREIRKGECIDVLAFAAMQGSRPSAKSLRHHLSLSAFAGDDLVAAAMCVEEELGQFGIRLVHSEDFDQALTHELIDRCLRKMQTEGIASARVTSPTECLAQHVWTQANWLDRIEETPPPQSTDQTPSEVAVAEDQVVLPA